MWVAAIGAACTNDSANDGPQLPNDSCHRVRTRLDQYADLFVRMERSSGQIMRTDKRYFGAGAPSDKDLGM
ncbi:MAG TPA: hypothetical protein VEW05_15125 [Candidatus Polarisedimenticolia bacterium]|nr:hypothetical protein [Candidatus Polarisedimenticolia bacterium]